tara:strand:+ start:200 stop:433 length:234 start_codon:yes stop_codon:yes gene_type:complete
MQSGFILCDPDNKKVLCISGDKTRVELVDINKTNNLNKALCLPDLTSVKNIYERFKKLDLVEELDIVNIAKLYKNRY